MYITPLNIPELPQRELDKCHPLFKQKKHEGAEGWKCPFKEAAKADLFLSLSDFKEYLYVNCQKGAKNKEH